MQAQLMLVQLYLIAALILRCVLKKQLAQHSLVLQSLLLPCTLCSQGVPHVLQLSQAQVPQQLVNFLPQKLARRTQHTAQQ